MVEKLAVEVALEGGEEVQRDLSKLQQGFVNAGNAVRDFATSFAELAALAGGAALVAAAAAMVKFANAAEETTKQLTDLQRATGATFESLSQLQQVFAAGGTTLNKFADSFGRLNEAIDAAGQARKIREADQEWVKWANSISGVREKFNNLANGASAVFSPLTTLQTKVQALKESLAEIKDPEERLNKLADIFKNLGDEAQRMQLGKALLLKPEEIATLSQGAAAIKLLQAETNRLGLTLTTENQAALQQATAGWNQFTALVSAALQKIGAAAAPAFGQLLETGKQILTAIVSDFETLPLDQAIAKLGPRLTQAFGAIFQVIEPALIRIGNTLGVALVQGMWDGISNALSTIWSNLGSELSQNFEILWQNLANLGAIEDAGIRMGARFVQGIISAITSAAGAIWEAIKSALGFAGGGEIGGGDIGLPMASGGVMGGRGTGTSDSNLAWVSRGEHIMPARAVAQPGVLAFLEALRRSGGNLSAVLDGMGRFALGGVVPQMQLRPAFANGGLVEGRRVLNLNIEGRSFAGLSVPESTAQALERFAVHSQIASTGRKPSWRR